MSSDRQVLTAIANVTQESMRFFEIVHIVWGPDKKKAVLAIGQSSATLLRLDLGVKVHKHSRFEYHEIIKVIKDKHSEDILVLVFDLSCKACQDGKSDHLMVKSENRELLLKHLQSCWQTHMMCKFWRPATFPLFTAERSKPDKFDFKVEPFKDYVWESYCNYKFMRPKGMLESPNAIRSTSTGLYHEESTGVSLQVKVHDPLTLDQLKLARREHIWWVAVEYKAKLVQDQNQFYIIRSVQRCKGMNLVGDLASWTGWELILRTRECTYICQLLRRMHMPPLCDSAQDISLVFTIPSEYWMKFEVQQMLQAQMIVDSVSPCATPGIYRELIQCKLDTLRFDEDGIEWIANYQRLHSHWRYEAIAFVRSIINIFVQSKVINNEELLTTDKYVALKPIRQAWLNQDLIHDWNAFFESCKKRGMQLLNSSVDEDDFETKYRRQRVANRLLERLARYFAWAVDGGFLGPIFNLELLLEKMPQLDTDEDKQITTALMFMLHLRDKQKEWYEDKYKLKEGGNDNCVFNDRVMQWIIHGEYLRKLFGRKSEGDYFRCLAQVLKTSGGPTLKAYICRIFMATASSGRTEGDGSLSVVPVLLQLARSGGVYLATFASAALVNMTHDNQIVKMQLMNQGLAQVVAQNIKSKDDDLICYTLTLMVNLTKEAHHRYIMAQAGLLPLLYDLLTSSYHQCRHAQGMSSNMSSELSHSAIKEKILANLSSVIGHFCKDEEYGNHLILSFPHTVKCLCYIATHAIYGTPLMCKVLYALKQLCSAHSAEREEIGAIVVKPLLQDQLHNAEVLQKCKSEFLTHAINLLQMLSSLKENCLRMDDVDGRKILQGLTELPSDKMSDQLKEQCRSLETRIREVVNRE
eukprot:CAMPEP_0206531276 /NCGR_PEP_ID=MMETSP0325_2-20121206/3667_1 /ASSEMBLY_ACC=CAM_ASM_000347 /TAXON_ID=2866 /ORGANISM="Crypthecodinium cohnii, Strain Seligo" /LENGTH=864 /DNA_ID=CAMNT_0054027485 /DNA_START=293 /DNA_END=2884 /DNA_ORIENTATION=-